MTHENQYFFRSPLLDVKQQVTGYRLAWQKNAQNAVSAAVDAGALLGFVAETVRDTKSGLLFIDATLQELSAKLLQTLLPSTTVLIFKAEELAAAENAALVTSLFQKGFGLAVRDVDLAFLTANRLLLSQTTYVLTRLNHPEFQEICNFVRQKMNPVCVVAEDIENWRVLEECAALGAYGFFENLCQAPRHSSRPTKLSPQARQILQLMQLVQGNTDIRDLEKVLKSDVTLSYKLLQYINSAGFGLKVEIESPRHAVAMLGYAPMFRWLLLLLARTNTAGFSQALMQAAMVRGRFAELLGQGFLPRREAENLFIVGMYSFLDLLLGVSAREVLGQMMLPAGVLQAIESRNGVYGQVLMLAEASERQDGSAANLAQDLAMTSTHVNQAHLSAIAWAQGIKL